MIWIVSYLELMEIRIFDFFFLAIFCFFVLLSSLYNALLT